MSMLADLMSNIFDRRYVPFRRLDRGSRSMEELCHDLLTSRGEVSGTELSRLILDGYDALDLEEKRAFFHFLNDELDLDIAGIETALDRYRADPERGNYRALMHVMEPPRQELVRRLNQLPDATPRLVAMRKDLMSILKDDPVLSRLDMDLRHLFKSWFNRGFLVLRPINWESPAHILEKITAYEAVHAIHSWRDLRRRLQPSDRRCFGFFHPSMPDEPLIFVEVALTRGIPNSVQALLAEEREELQASEADTAVFYSISNCQAGLAGISFGNSLIKQVVGDLSRELPGLKTFVTLSPVPSLARWLNSANIPQPQDPEALRGAAAHYLTGVRDSKGLPRDPVARFHLNNGAQLHDIHAGADISANGMAQSHGIMVNYLYDLARIDKNHEAFASAQKVASAGSVQALAKQYAPSPAEA
ncbi:MAG: malonyl-CoA decarboxylase [Mangrovicoccus sp.]|nr:malonyl-CoA decarboxylase [Mangrovicoccus sp.]